MSRREYIGTVENKDGANAYGYVNLSPEKFSWLGNIAKCFERVTWHSCKILWKPLKSATTSGSMVMGVDWDSQTNSQEQDYAHIVACTPSIEVPIWQQAVLVLPSSRLQTRKEYNLGNKDDFDAMPGYIMYTSSGIAEKGTYGHLWVEYDVSFFGTQKSP